MSAPSERVRRAAEAEDQVARILRIARASCACRFTCDAHIALARRAVLADLTAATGDSR